jgi:response regulator RpfG family c-di-GMP phosphodiesterase
MNKKILFVDDDTNILASYKRSFRLKYEVHTASLPTEGLEMIKENAQKPFSVIISDFKMPEMNGTQFLTRAYELSRNSVRMLITGYADVDTAISAVNDGNVFRFLTKPCPPETLSKNIDACIEHYQLIVAEKELLRGTLQGSIKVLTDVLSITNPAAFGQSERIKRIVHLILKNLNIENKWQIEVGAMLCQLGCAAIPAETLEKIYKNKPLTPQEQTAYDEHPKIGAQLIKNIPRMDIVADLIEKQNYTEAEKNKTPIGTRIIRMIHDFDIISKGGTEVYDAIRIMKEKQGIYDTKLLELLEKVVSPKDDHIQRSLMLKDLREGMIVMEDIETTDRILLIKKGQILSEASILRLNNYGKSVGVKEPISVLIELK